MWKQEKEKECLVINEKKTISIYLKKKSMKKIQQTKNVEHYICTNLKKK